MCLLLLSRTKFIVVLLNPSFTYRTVWAPQKLLEVVLMLDLGDGQVLLALAWTTANLFRRYRPCTGKTNYVSLELGMIRSSGRASRAPESVSLRDERAGSGGQQGSSGGGVDQEVINKPSL